MLEQLRQNSRSFIIWILFGIIIAVFIVSFGPQAGPDTLGCGGNTSFAVRVGDQDVSTSSWRFAYNGMALIRQFPGGGATRRHIAIDTVVERELLAQAAETSGFRVSTDLVNERIQQGHVYIGGFVLDGRQAYFDGGVEGVFDYELLERFVNSSLSLPSVPYYIEEQRREILADMMRTRLVSAVTVSSEEARSQYIQENTKIKVDYVKFDPAAYARSMTVGEEHLRAYIGDHEEELKKDFERSKASYEKAQAWVLARHILIKKDPPKPKPPENKDGDDEKAPEKPLESAEPDAKQRAAAIAARIAKGEKFAAVATEVSDDDKTKARGGSLGWRPATSLGWGKELVEAAKTLEPGKISEPVESQYGVHLLWIDEKTDKGLTFDQKKLDLAAIAAPRYYAKKRAQLDASAALAAVQGKKLADVYERSVAPVSPIIPPGGDQALTPEQMEMLRKQMMEQMEQQQRNTPPPGQGTPPADEGKAPADEGKAPADEGKSESGWIIREGPNVLAQIGSDEETAPKKKAPPKNKTPDTEPDAPPTPAEGSGKGARPLPGNVPASPPPPAADENVPEVKDMPAPVVRTVGPVARQGDGLAGIGRAPELVRSLFDEIAVGAVGAKVYEVEDALFVIQLVERTDADMEKFPEVEAEIKSDLRQGKGVQLLAEWLESRCRNAATSGTVEVAREVLYEDPDTKKVTPYSACQYITIQTILGQQQSRMLSGLF